MIRLPLIIAAGAVATAAAVIPAVAGLTGNPSFTQHVPVRVPAHASIATFPTGDVGGPLASPRRSASRVGDDGSPGREPEAGDDRGQERAGARGRDDGAARSERSASASVDDRGQDDSGSHGGEHG